MVARGKWGEGIVTEFGRDMHTLLYLKCVTRTDFWTLWEKARVDVQRIALKQVYYQG